MAVLPPMEASTCASSVVGHLDEVDPAHVRRRGEAGEIADRAAAQRDDGGGPVAAGLEQAVPGLAGDVERLGLLLPPGGGSR